MLASLTRRRCVLLFVEQKDIDKFVHAWYRIIIYFQVQFIYWKFTICTSIFY